MTWSALVSLSYGGRVIHVRSASRSGIYDFGVNRRRVERLRRQLSSTDLFLSGEG